MPVPAHQRPARLPRSDAEIPPGPNAGRVWRDAPAVTRDAFSGREITRLTGYRGHSHHLVGAAPLWLDGGRRLLVVSDREGCGNLFACDFAAGALTQLTDLRAGERPAHAAFLASGLLAFAYGRAFYALDLASLRMRETAAPRAPRRPATAPATVGETLLPDGRRLLWLDSARARRALALITGSGTAPHALTAPCLRPGAEQVVFVSDAGGYAQIYAIDARAPATLPLAFGAMLSHPLHSPRAASAPRPTSPPA